MIYNQSHITVSYDLKRKICMFIDSKKPNGPYICGHSHEMITKAVVIEPGCLMEFGRYMKEFGLEGRRAAVYDRNTYHATGLIRPAADQEILLNPINLHANETAAFNVLERLGPDIKFLVAVGSGTIHDITRYCAHRRGIPFMACPTAASVDGFCSTVSAMTWEGYKKTLPGTASQLLAQRQKPPYVNAGSLDDQKLMHGWKVKT